MKVKAKTCTKIAKSTGKKCKNMCSGKSKVCSRHRKQKGGDGADKKLYLVDYFPPGEYGSQPFAAIVVETDAEKAKQLVCKGVDCDSVSIEEITSGVSILPETEVGVIQSTLSDNNF